MKQIESTRSLAVIFPVKLAGLLQEAAEQVPLDIVQPLHWPSTQVQAVLAGNGADPVEQAPLGHVASGSTLVKMSVWTCYSSLRLSQVRQAIHWMINGSIVPCATGDQISQARRHGFLAFQPDYSLPPVTGFPADWGPLEQLQLCEQACRDRRLPLPGLFEGIAVPPQS